MASQFAKGNHDLRCGKCGSYIDGVECANCGDVYICHCGEFRPIVSRMDHAIRVECDCVGSSTGKATVKAD